MKTHHTLASEETAALVELFVAVNDELHLRGENPAKILAAKIRSVRAAKNAEKSADFCGA